MMDSFVTNNPQLALWSERILKLLPNVVPAFEYQYELGEALSTVASGLRMVTSAKLVPKVLGSSSTSRPEDDTVQHSRATQKKLIQALAIIESLQTLVEMALKKGRGRKAARAFVVLIEVSKMATRLFLLLKYGNHTYHPETVLSLNVPDVLCADCNGVLQSCLCPNCDEAFFAAFAESDSAHDPTSNTAVQCPDCQVKVHVHSLINGGEKGQRTGVTVRMTADDVEQSSGCRLCVARIRRIEKSRGTYLRLKHVHQQGLKSSGLTQYTLASEALDTARPCLHLLLQRLFGRKSWIPLVASFILEVLSTYIRAQGWKHLTPEEKKEHSARLRLLLLYLIRTPVWEAVTRKQLVVIIGFIRNYVPLARLFTGGVVDYADTMVDLHSFQWQTRL
eukprot:m.37446 g.37446  ORF g.37446 m.37446 type:complete len:392 (-) comp10093_c1_seq2:232-1407(-)